MDGNYIGQWSIHAIGTLDQVGFSAQLPLYITGEWTIAFWYYATECIRRQVMLSIDSILEIVIEDNHLKFELSHSGDKVITLDLPTLGSWHHVACSMSTDLIIYVDGTHVFSSTLAQPPLLNESKFLHVGGYTDPAGGHYDYTFGRNQTGWIDDIQILSKQTLSFQATMANLMDSQIPLISLGHRQLDADTFEFVINADNQATIRFCLWDFGDRQTDIGEQVNHTYPFAGKYTVRLTAVLSDYRQLHDEHTITVINKSTALEKVPVFQNGKEGHACYRIPSIISAANGNLIAFAEARLEDCSDSTRTVRLVCKRSSDYGKTWTPLQIVARNLVDNDEFAVQQNAPVVDKVRNTGRIIVLYNKLENSEFEIAKGIGQSRLFCMYSDDHGVTWHDEKDITAQVHRPSRWRVQRPTLGHAIQLRSGRLLFAGMMTDGDRSVFESQNYLFWSDDLGDTWSMSDPIPHIGLNEATAVELENGEIMINSRAYQHGKPVGRRAVTIARFTSIHTVEFGRSYFDQALVDPTIQASIMRYTWSNQLDYGNRSRLLFTNPNHPNARYNLSIRLSYDEGQTWNIRKTIDHGPSAYSDLVIQDNMQIGVLYEQGNHGGIVYTNFTLDWLTDGSDTIEG